MNPTQQPIKRPLQMPEPIPDSESDRTADAQRMNQELFSWGPEAVSQLTSFEVETNLELTRELACTRIRYKIVRDAYQRIKKQLGK